MGKRFFRRFTSGAEAIRNHQWLNWLAPGLKHPSLWHLNRHSVARAMAIGVFWALIPMPWQMVPAVLSAIWLRANVGISAGVVWISNPLTWGPIWYGAYRLGRWIMGQGAPELSGEGGSRAMMQHMNTIWRPLYLGSLLAGLLLAIITYYFVHLAWRAGLAGRWRLRQRRRLVAAGSAGD